MGLRAHAAGYPDGCALTGLEVPLGGQLFVCGGDDSAGDAELGGQPAARWQSRACGQASVANGVAQRALELLVERPLAAALEAHQEVNWPSQSTHKLELYGRPALL